MGSRQSTNFCSNCGSVVNPDDAFCSNCGSAVGGSEWEESTVDGGSAVGGSAVGGASSVSGGSATDGRSLRRRVEDLTIEGWEVEHDYGDRVVLANRGFGSWGVHAILAVFTGGLGNVAYAWYNYSPGADRLELRADGTHRYVSGSGSRDGDSSGPTLRTAGSVAVSFLCALIGLAILGGGVSSLPTFFVGVTFLVTALYAFPPIRKRVHERKSITAFGSVRSTDEEIVDAPDVPCTACSRPVDTGVERSFHETVYVAGFPVSREEKGTNHYCRSCAQGDPFAGDSDILDAEKRETEREF